MDLLSWLAFSSYIVGAALALEGIRDIRRAVVRDRAALARLQKGLSGSSTKPIAEMPAFTHGHIDQAVRILDELLRDGTRWKRPVAFLVAAVVVEVGGNLLSLPW